tara:strand:- start:5762 stop:5959 length:198 start_codon:yes stop_codon:yes gene_type:complete
MISTTAGEAPVIQIIDIGLINEWQDHLVASVIQQDASRAVYIIATVKTSVNSGWWKYAMSVVIVV